MSQRNELFAGWRESLDAALASGMALAYFAAERPDAMAVQSRYGSRTFAALNANANRLARLAKRASSSTTRASRLPLRRSRMRRDAASGSRSAVASMVSKTTSRR